MELPMRAKAVETLVSVLLIVLVALLFSAWIRRDRSRTAREAARLVHGEPSRGPDKIRKYGCYTCHTIGGVEGANGLVGPPLDGISRRVFIAGELPNTPENITRWIQHPRSVEPHTAMPEMGVTDSDSRDIAAYLYTLK
jgi:cytochrome c